MRHEKSCGAVVYRADKYLLIRHTNGRYWGFPKGHVEKDETETETARREVYEETGLDIRFIMGFRETISYMPVKNTIKEAVYFLAFAKRYEVALQQEEICSYAWLGFEDALCYLSFDDLKAVFRKAHDFLKRD